MNGGICPTTTLSCQAFSLFLNFLPQLRKIVNRFIMHSLFCLISASLSVSSCTFTFPFCSLSPPPFLPLPLCVMKTINECLSSASKRRTDGQTDRDGRFVMLINGFALLPLSLYSTSCWLKHTHTHTQRLSSLWAVSGGKIEKKTSTRCVECAAREKPPPATQARLLVVYC